MKHANGVTLPELLLCCTLLGVMCGLALPALGQFVDRQAVVARANNVLGLVRLAKASAAARGPVLLCAQGTDCGTFPTHSGGLKLVLDSNDNRRHDKDEAVLYQLMLDKGETISWRSFRGRPWLRINSRGVAWYQNGHFLLCRQSVARKVILNRQGRGRVAPAGESRRRCPG